MPSGEPWANRWPAPWRNPSGLYIHPAPRGRGKRWINLEMVPNGILAHRLIEHAAIPNRIPVNLDRE
jgi:hypothetical protein